MRWVLRGAARGVVSAAEASIRSDACCGRHLWGNDLDGTLPAELGKLTDLELLCVSPPLWAAAVRSDFRRVGSARLRAAMICRGCNENKFSGTIGSWIGSMAKLNQL